MKTRKPKIEKVKPSADRDKLRHDFYSGVKQQQWNVVETIRRFRIMLGMSQIEFADYSGLTARAIKEFEQGKRNPTLKTLTKMLKGSGLTIGVIPRKGPL